MGKLKMGAKTFEISQLTCPSMNYNKTGMSYFLFQKHYYCSGEANPSFGNSHWKIILGGSRSINYAVSCYSLVKDKALALVCGLESFQMFVLGCPNLLVTLDHQPHAKIFSGKALENIKTYVFLVSRNVL